MIIARSPRRVNCFSLRKEKPETARVTGRGLCARLSTCLPLSRTPARGAGRQTAALGVGALSDAACLQATVGKGGRWADAADAPRGRHKGCAARLRGPLRDRRLMEPGPLTSQCGPDTINPLLPPLHPASARRRPSPEQRAEGELQRPQPSRARHRAPTATNGSQRPLRRRRPTREAWRKPEGKKRQVKARPGRWFSVYAKCLPKNTALSKRL
ncbi:uncharacterized protein LOC115599909 [Calypte anna]|uniref:uncharacterized protein LOC115599909 n=1 Tax=Calypte anna TaxID=9244 RepID=UPI0011C3D7C4|nr:uncharacterized protein LOC115599909 [Calypte anna]